MKRIKTYIEEIEILLIQVLSIVESFNDRDLDAQLSSAQAIIGKVTLLKKEIKERFNNEEIEPFKENLRILTKQIEEKLDNSIKEKNLEKERIAHEIEQLNNNKKLQNYRR